LIVVNKINEWLTFVSHGLHTEYTKYMKTIKIFEHKNDRDIYRIISGQPNYLLSKFIKGEIPVSPHLVHVGKTISFIAKETEKLQTQQQRQNLKKIAQYDKNLRQQQKKQKRKKLRKKQRKQTK